MSKYGQMRVNIWATRLQYLPNRLYINLIWSFHNYKLLQFFFNYVGAFFAFSFRTRIQIIFIMLNVVKDVGHDHISQGSV